MNLSPPQKQRFAFGQNWARFLAVVNEDRIVTAVGSLQSLLGAKSLEGQSFLDVGSGSGLFSLAAMRLGAARVHSFDFDANSVGCAEYLKQRFFPSERIWCIERGDILDEKYLKSLGTFDVVYSWGVLHHTGQMWRGLDIISQLVRPDGRLVVALYNDQGWISDYWRVVKGIHNQGRSGRILVRSILLPCFVLGFFIKDIVRLRAPLHRYMTRTGPRGMSVFHDLEDWLGGYPFEVASPESVVEFYGSKSFRCEKANLVGRRMGCNEFTFRRLK